MSLINEALKRVQQSQATRRPDTAADLRQLRPVENTGMRTHTGRMLAMAGLMFVIGGGLFLFTVVMGRTRTGPGAPVSAVPEHVRTVQTAQESAGPPQILEHGTTLLPAQQGRPTADQTAVQAAHPGAVGSAPAPSKPDAAMGGLKPETGNPEPKLQGIVYLRDGAAAVINGKTVRVGGKVGGWTVKAITRDRVNLEGEGQTKFLTLE